MQRKKNVETHWNALNWNLKEKLWMAAFNAIALFSMEVLLSVTKPEPWP